jgi:trimeric autotransporter adhesin
LVTSGGQLGIATSSRRYKEDIQDMGDASGGLLRLRPVTFRYKQAYADGSKPIQYGLVAEEVAEAYPDLVVRSADGQIQTVKYQVLDSMLLNELQKQNKTISALEERVTKLEAALERTVVSASSQK